jgi:hypothetical protein
MIPHHVVFIHGIGDRRDGFSLWLQKKIRKEFARTVFRLSSEKPPENGIHFCEALWSEVTQRDQDKLWEELFPWMGKRNIPKMELPRNPRNWFFRLKYWSWLRKLVVNYQGDLIAYIESPGANKYGLIHGKIYEAFESCTKLTLTTEATAQNPALLTVVAHSLGAVIASDMLYDTLVKKTRWWPPQLRLANLMSLGSPLALYKLRYGYSKETFQETIKMQDKNGLWINIYDPQDVIGYPLKNLNKAYEAAVSLDKEINVGQWWNPWHLIRQNTPLNHNLYLEDNTVAATIGRKAALDWLQTNKPELEPVLKREYDEYGKWLQKV